MVHHQARRDHELAAANHAQCEHHPAEKAGGCRRSSPLEVVVDCLRAQEMQIEQMSEAPRRQGKVGKTKGLQERRVSRDYVVPSFLLDLQHLAWASIGL